MVKMFFRGDYICPRCRSTWSVIPPGMMPYRSIEVERFEELADSQLGSTGGDARPPPATEKEEECIRRAMKKLSERIPLLCGLLGQQMPAPVGMDIGSFWRALRKLCQRSLQNAPPVVHFEVTADECAARPCKDPARHIEGYLGIHRRRQWIFRKPSLCIAFKRVFGITPGTYRKLRQPGE